MSDAPRTLPEMCDTCQFFNLLQICCDYNIPLVYEPIWDHTEWVLNNEGTYTKTFTTTIRPDFSKWDGHTGVDNLD